VEIVVETEPPHDVAVYRIPAEVIEAGHDEYHRLMLKLAECKRSGEWPGAVDGEPDVSLPSWVYGADSDSDLGDLGLEA
jgi:hypothetical protein